MNSHQAKAEPLDAFLARLGYQPAHIRGNDLWYRSPFRPDERTPSFKIDRAKNVWYDHGLGEGGTIIDFMLHLHDTDDVAHVLTAIADILGNAPRAPIVRPSIQAPSSSPVIVESVGAIGDRGLEAYLTARGIPLDLARLYLQEIAYRVGSQGYKALAFGNDAGGFEVRNPAFKGTIGKKDLTFLAHPDSREAAIFEGFFDFLSVLTYYRRDRAAANILVVNSLALLDRGMARIEQADIHRLHAYLDHDPAGIAALTTLHERFSGKLIEASHVYHGHKDANAWLIAQRQRLTEGRER